MADEAPCVPEVSGGLFFWPTARRLQLASALAISLALHAAIFTASALPRIYSSGSPGGSHLRGELRPALASGGVALPTQSSSPAWLEQERKRPIRSKRASDHWLAAGRPSSAESTTGSLESVAAASLSAYRLAVARQARQFKSYPMPAWVTDIATELVFAMRCGPGNRWPDVSLQQSSGNPQLDEVALSMVTRAVRRTPLPMEWRGRHLQIELPMLFVSE